MASNNQGGNQGGDTSNRGFASMDPERQREIASEGGKAAHESGNAHEFTSEEAREAGKKGGQASGGGNQGGGSGG
jgi:general stress protein YciG